MGDKGKKDKAKKVKQKSTKKDAKKEAKKKKQEKQQVKRYERQQGTLLTSIGTSQECSHDPKVQAESREERF